MTRRIPLLSNRISLRLTLVVAIIAPLAVTMAATGYLVLAFLEEKVEQRMQKDLELVARAIQLPLSHALERGREGSVALALESAFSIGCRKGRSGTGTGEIDRTGSGRQGTR